MLSSIKQRIDRDEEGFTLIELMVVLLIIAILLAIAIPTFLGARNTANARSTQENLRNALTAEQTNWTSNQTFNTGLSNLEPSLNWGTTSPLTTKGGNDVEVGLFYMSAPGTCTAGVDSNGNADGVVLMGFAKDNNCYAIFQSDNASADFTAYTEWPSGGSCTMPSSPPASAPSQTTGSAAAHQTSASTSATWYYSF